MNVNFSSAADVNQTTNDTLVNSTGNADANSSSPNLITSTLVNSSLDNSTTNTTVNTTNTVANSATSNSSANSTVHVVNSTMAAGTPALVNGLTVAQLKDGLSRAQTFFNKYHRLPKYVSFGTRKILIATFVKNLATDGLKVNTTIVNGLTVADLKTGLAKAQAYYNAHGRLPNYVSFGTRHVAIATFVKNLATQGLKINTTKTTTTTVTKPNTSSVAALAASLKGSTTYNTAVNIYNWVRNNINYSFYYNTKYGAAGTLKRLSGNCCDTSNLLVALARAAGIQARYVHGYCHFSSGWYGHVCAQLYVNGKWYTADATSSKNSFGVVKNWNTATNKVYGYYTTLPF